MGYIIRMPQMGMSMEEGTVVEWTVNEGETVDEDMVIAIVESEKASADVESREDGMLRVVLAEEGTVVEPGDPIGIVAGRGESIETYLDEIDTGSLNGAAGERTGETTDDTDRERDPPDASESNTDESTGSDDAVKATPGAKKRARKADINLTTVEGSGPGDVVTEDDVKTALQHIEANDDREDARKDKSSDRDTTRTDTDVKATPGAKRRAETQGIDLTSVSGSGPGGVVTKEDIEARMDSSNVASTESNSVPETGRATPEPTISDRRSLSGIQQSIADRLSRSDSNAVHVTVNREIAAVGLRAVRLAANRTADQSISVTDVLLAAVTETLRSHPDFNAHYVEDEHIRYEDINLGVAVDAEAGLVTPVVRSAQNRSLEELAAERSRLTDRVQRGEFTGDDLAGSTFTVTNLGMFGVDHFDPVLNPPEVGILGVGRIRPDGQITLSLSFDHRVVNGADAGRFLETLAGYLTDDSELFAVPN